MKLLSVLPLILLGAIACGGAEDTPVGATNLDVAFARGTVRLASDKVGIHPNLDVLDDPNNPFQGIAPGALIAEQPGVDPTPLKWVIGADNNRPVVRFYSWATILTEQQNGENQFFAATSLHDVWGQGWVAPEQSDMVLAMVIAAYQAQLDYFPNDFNRTATGAFNFDFATASVKAITELSGVAPEGWILVLDENGNERAVHIGPEFVPSAAEDEE